MDEEMVSGSQLRAMAAYLLLLPGDVPDPPAEVLQPVVPLLAAAHRHHLRRSTSGTRSRATATKAARSMHYLGPGPVEVPVVEVADDLLHEVARGAVGCRRRAAGRSGGGENGRT